jgi:hypothetical protein
VSTLAVQMSEPRARDFAVDESTFTYTAADGEVNAPLFAYAPGGRALTISVPGAPSWRARAAPAAALRRPASCPRRRPCAA